MLEHKSFILLEQKSYIVSEQKLQMSSEEHSGTGIEALAVYKREEIQQKERRGHNGDNLSKLLEEQYKSQGVILQQS